MPEMPLGSGPVPIDSLREVDEWVSKYRRLWDARLDRFEEALRTRPRARAKNKEK